MHRSKWCLLGAVATLLFCWTEEGVAAEKRIHAAACHIDHGTQNSIDGTFLVDDGWQLGGLTKSQSGSFGYYGMWNSASAPMGLICPYPDDDLLSKNDVTTLKVYGYADTGNPYGEIQFRTCRTYTTTDGGTCSASIASVSQGQYALTLSNTSGWDAGWSTSTGFGYLFVFLSEESSFRGFSVTDL